MRFELRALSENDGRDVYEMLQEMPGDENGFINPASGKTYEEYREWLKACVADARQQGIVDGWKVPQSTYWLLADGVPVGYGKIRHFLTEALLRCGGNVGYAVRPLWRGRGCGKALLSALLEKCPELGVDRALITAHEKNTPSIRTALANGGTIEKIEDGRVFIWIAL